MVIGQQVLLVCQSIRLPACATYLCLSCRPATYLPLYECPYLLRTVTFLVCAYRRTASVGPPVCASVSPPPNCAAHLRRSCLPADLTDGDCPSVRLSGCLPTSVRPSSEEFYRLKLCPPPSGRTAHPPVRTDCVRLSVLSTRATSYPGRAEKEEERPYLRVCVLSSNLICDPLSSLLKHT